MEILSKGASKALANLTEGKGYSVHQHRRRGPAHIWDKNAPVSFCGVHSKAQQVLPLSQGESEFGRGTVCKSCIAGLRVRIGKGDL